MSKKDRAVFMNDLAKPDTETNIPKIIDKHYHKFNYAYAIVDHIESFSSVRKQIKNIETEDLEECVEIAIKLKKTGDMDKVVSLVEEYIEENNSDVSANIQVKSADKLNISINTNFIEEDMYDDNRLDTNKEIYNGESS